MRVLIIDNYDSFTYNLYQYIGEILISYDRRFVVDVVRNNKITLREIKKKKYNRIIISPGPGDPADKNYFGICAEVIIKLGKTIPILGVCLGMQGIAYYFGGKVIRAKVPMHGKTSIISHDGKGVFKDLPQNLEVMRYHSLVAKKDCLPDCLEISSLSLDSNEIMGLRHKIYPVEGIQFHPESFATEGGKKILTNFLFC
ncbi:aminodeoxychorismate/anthranilate synthase component II [Candidatus Daviesbacteria bacterium]|nr:aminodeoxychorismate/anthranilate synthase component II [Candidatus Daviesbacteria bacterium]